MASTSKGWGWFEEEEAGTTTEVIKKTLEKSFWNGMATELQQTPKCYTRLFRLVAGLKGEIKHLAGEDMKQEIEDVLDLDLMEQQVHASVFGERELLNLAITIVEIIKKIQLPIRRAEMETPWEEKRAAMESSSPLAFCEGFKFLSQQIKILNLDAANARLRLISPVVFAHGVEYEQLKMRKKLENGEISLNNTRAWIKESLGRFPVHVIHQITQRNSLAMIKVHGSALVNLVENKNLKIPETLQFDTYRFELMRSQYEWLVFSSVIVVTVLHCAGKTHALEATQGLIIAYSTKEDDWKNQCISIGAAAVGSMALENYMRVIQMRVQDPLEPVHSLMTKRVREVWEQAVGGGHAELRGAEGLKNLALEWIGELALVANINRQVHGPLYDQIMPEAAATLL